MLERAGLAPSAVASLDPPDVHVPGPPGPGARPVGRDQKVRAVGREPRSPVSAVQDVLEAFGVDRFVYVHEPDELDVEFEGYRIDGEVGVRELSYVLDQQLTVFVRD